MKMKHFVMLISTMLTLGGCAALSPATFPDLVSEEHIRPNLKDRIRHRLHWMGPEQKWHYKCLYSKPVSHLIKHEQSFALRTADLIYRANWDEKRMAYGSAYKLYQKAADENLPYAFAKLGALSIKGHGVAKDAKKGVILLQQSARLNCAQGQYLYAQALSQGTGVRSNLIQAWAWVEMARLQDYPGAKTLQKRIKNIMRPEHLIQAQTKADQLYSQFRSFEKGGQDDILVHCTTQHTPRSFVTRLLNCHAMNGSYTPY